MIRNQLTIRKLIFDWMTSSSSQTSILVILTRNIKVSKKYGAVKKYEISTTATGLVKFCSIVDRRSRSSPGTQLIWSTREIVHHDPNSLDVNVINLELFLTGFIKSGVFRNKR